MTLCSPPQIFSFVPHAGPPQIRPPWILEDPLFLICRPCAVWILPAAGTGKPVQTGTKRNKTGRFPWPGYVETDYDRLSFTGRFSVLRLLCVAARVVGLSHQKTLFLQSLPRTLLVPTHAPRTVPDH